MIRILLATRNAHKTRELIQLLGGDFAVTDLSKHPEIGEVIEDGKTFADNARLKSLAVSRVLPGWIVGDDSGLEVDSLGGAPGIYSGRYAGAAATDAENRRKLLEELGLKKGKQEHQARFRCVLSLAGEGKEVANFDGTVEGVIVEAERGENGFGYDALFQPNGGTRTFAEFSAEQKNTLSHRAMAAIKLRNFLTKPIHSRFVRGTEAGVRREPRL